MTQEAIVIGLSFAFILLAALTYAFGHARGRLAEQDDLRHKMKRADQHLDKAWEIRDDLEEMLE